MARLNKVDRLVAIYPEKEFLGFTHPNLGPVTENPKDLQYSFHFWQLFPNYLTD
jgi:hypothetical protein